MVTAKLRGKPYKTRYILRRICLIFNYKLQDFFLWFSTVFVESCAGFVHCTVYLLHPLSLRYGYTASKGLQTQTVNRKKNCFAYFKELYKGYTSKWEYSLHVH